MWMIKLICSILFSALDVECQWCINMVLGIFFSSSSRGNKIASFCFSLRSVTLLKFVDCFLSYEDWLNGGKEFSYSVQTHHFLHTDCCLTVCASVNMWQIKYRKFSHSGQDLFIHLTDGARQALYLTPFISSCCVFKPRCFLKVGFVS